MKLSKSILVAVILLMAGSAAAQDTAEAQTGTYVEAPPAHEASGSGIKDTSIHHRPYSASALLYVPWWYGIGIGLKLGFEIPIVHDGFIPKLNDSFSLEPSFTFAYSTYYSTNDVSLVRYTPAISALWSFYLSDRFRVYGALNLGLTVLTYHDDLAYFDHDNSYYFYGELAAGLFYNFSDVFALRAELGWQGLRGGIAFQF